MDTESLCFVHALANSCTPHTVGELTVYPLTPFSHKDHDCGPGGNKIAVVQTLYSRAQILTSSAVTRTQEQHTISKALAQNGYPATFIHRHSQPSHDPTSRSQPPNVTTSATIPYIKGTSEAIRRVLSPLGIRVERAVYLVCVQVTLQ